MVSGDLDSFAFSFDHLARLAAKSVVHERVDSSIVKDCEEKSLADTGSADAEDTAENARQALISEMIFF